MIARSLENLKSGWNHFWFVERPASSLSPTRIAICAMIFAWYTSYWSEVAIWFGSDGILKTNLAAKLVAFDEIARWQIWSPLWWTDSEPVYYTWIVLGCITTILGGLGVGGRWTFLALFLISVSWCNRLTWLSGLTDPVVCAFAGYFILFPGCPIWDRSTNGECSWMPNAVLRLIQVHAWLLLAATVLNQLIGVIWWRGEAVWWLASADQSYLFTTDLLSNRPVMVNGISHLWILCELLALWLLATRSARPFGIVFGVLSALAIGFAADQALYGLMIAAAITAFVPGRSSRND